MGLHQHCYEEGEGPGDLDSGKKIEASSFVIWHLYLQEMDVERKLDPIFVNSLPNMAARTFASLVPFSRSRTLRLQFGSAR